MTRAQTSARLAHLREPDVNEILKTIDDASGLGLFEVVVPIDPAAATPFRTRIEEMGYRVTHDPAGYLSIKW